MMTGLDIYFIKIYNLTGISLNHRSNDQTSIRFTGEGGKMELFWIIFLMSILSLLCGGGMATIDNKSNEMLFLYAVWLIVVVIVSAAISFAVDAQRGQPSSLHEGEVVKVISLTVMEEEGETWGIVRSLEDQHNPPGSGGKPELGYDSESRLVTIPKTAQTGETYRHFDGQLFSWPPE